MPNIDLSEHTTSPTLIAMEEYWQNDQRENLWIRNLGASSIGEDCLRKQWFSWRYVLIPEFPSRILRLFSKGHREEEVFIKELKYAGVKVYGCQDTILGYKGHFTAHPDGKALGILESPKTEHILEFKTMSEKTYKALLKKGCKEAQPKHHAQMQIQMHLTGITRAFYLTVNKNTDDVYAERISYDKAEGERLQSRIELIVNANQPPVCNESYQCKWCEFRGMCDPKTYPEEKNTPVLNCRTCIHATPAEGGRWLCGRHNDNEIPKDFQLKGCSKHLLIPDILVAEVDETDGSTFVLYANGLLNHNDEYVSDGTVDRENTLTHGVPF